MNYLFMIGKADTAGQRMRAMREYAGLTQQELAEESGVSWQTILRFEKDNKVNRTIYDNFMLICEGLSKYVSAEKEIVAAIIVGGKPLYKIAQKSMEII